MNEPVSDKTCKLLLALPEAALMALKTCATEDGCSGWWVWVSPKGPAHVYSLMAYAFGPEKSYAVLPANPIAILRVAEHIGSKRGYAYPIWAADYGQDADKSGTVDEAAISMENHYFRVVWGLVGSGDVEVEPCGRATQDSPPRAGFASQDDRERWMALSVLAQICGVEVL